MATFFQISKRTFLCGDCGGTTRHQKTHEKLTAHVKAVAGQTYRHRDDSLHSTMGPIGCYVCACLRRAAREDGYQDAVAKMLAIAASEMGEELVATEPPPPLPQPASDEPLWEDGARGTETASDTIDHDEVLRQVREDQGEDRGDPASFDPEP